MASVETSASQDSWERTRELLREIRLIEIQTSRLVDEHLAGSYHSAFKGSGMTFSEVRAYEPGDDIRSIDWNVTARTGEAHVKVFEEERQQTVVLLVDMSGSLDFGSREFDKRQLVARLVATFAFSAIRNNDRVGLIGFSDRVELFVPPRSGRKHVLAVVHQVLTHQPQSRGTRLASALEAMARMRKSGAVVVLISDFVEALRGAEGVVFERALKLVRRRHDVIPVRVEDPAEKALPPLGLVAMEDLELLGLGGDGFYDLSRGRAARYGEAVARDRNELEALLMRLRLELMSVETGGAWQQAMIEFFQRRARRTGR